MIWYFHHRPIGSLGLHVDTPLVRSWDNERVYARGRLERKDEEGLLYERVQKFESSSMKASLKHEVIQHVYKRMMNVLKALDDDLLAGKFNIDPFKYEKERVGEGKQSKSENLGEEADESKGFTKGNENVEGIERTPDKQNERDARLFQLYTYCTGTCSGTLANDENLVGWHTKFLTRHDMKDMQPCSWVNSMVVDFAGMVINVDEGPLGLLPIGV